MPIITHKIYHFRYILHYNYYKEQSFLKKEKNNNRWLRRKFICIKEVLFSNVLSKKNNTKDLVFYGIIDLANYSPGKSQCSSSMLDSQSSRKSSFTESLYRYQSPIQERQEGNKDSISENFLQCLLCFWCFLHVFKKEKSFFCKWIKGMYTTYTSREY